MEGLIIKNISNDYLVKSGDNTYLCKPRGKFRYHGLSPLVGDHVVFDEGNGYLLAIHERKNSLVRPSVANIDQAIVVASVKSPDFDSYLLDKLLTVISYHRIKPVICFTKLDLLSDLEKENIESRPVWKPMHMQPVFKENDFIKVKENAVSEDLFERGICLPSDTKMTVEEQSRVIEIIKNLFIFARSLLLKYYWAT